MPSKKTYVTEYGSTLSFGRTPNRGYGRYMGELLIPFFLDDVFCGDLTRRDGSGPWRVRLFHNHELTPGCRSFTGNITQCKVWLRDHFTALETRARMRLFDFLQPVLTVNQARIGAVAETGVGSNILQGHYRAELRIHKLYDGSLLLTLIDDALGAIRVRMANEDVGRLGASGGILTANELRRSLGLKTIDGDDTTLEPDTLDSLE